MRVLYLLSLRFFHFAVLVSSLFHNKARLFVRGRRGLFRDLQQAVAGWQQVVWFHCASLGEFEQGRPVIEQIKQSHPHVKILLTFFSPSGYQVRKNYAFADYVTYLPVDGPHAARRFVDIVRPDQVFFIKYEYWYYFLRALYKRQVPVYLISAIFRRHQVFFKWYGGWFRRMLRFFTHLFVQDEASADLLKHYRITQVTVSGDTRFDRVRQVAGSARALPLVEQFKGGHFLLVAGSTWPADEELLARYFQNTSHDYKMLLAPHEVHEQHIQRIMNRFNPDELVRWSEAAAEKMTRARVLVVDAIGLLSSLYGYGNLAYVGGGFGNGIHNILEAATYDIPVIFGPNYHKFKEALDLARLGGAFPQHNYQNFPGLMDDLLENPRKLKSAGQIAGDYVRRQAGATRVILSKVAFY